MLVCGIIAGAALFFLYAAYSSSKKHPAAGICAFAAGAIDLIYQYFMAKELSELTDGEFKNLINFITNNKLYYDTNQYNNKLLITILCILGIVFTIAVITVLIYSIKKKMCCNSSFDNRANRATTVMFIIIFICLTVAAGGFGINTFKQIELLKSEYKNAFNFVIEAEKSCSTQEEIVEYLKNSDYNFGDVDIENDKYYTYSNNLVNLTVELYEPEETNEDAVGIEKLLNDYYEKSDYAGRYVYSINLTTNNNYFDNGYDSLTLSTLKADEEKLETLYSFKPYEHTNVERYEYYKKYMPTEFSCTKCCRELVESKFEFRYIEGSGELKDTNYFEFSTETQPLLDFKKREPEITQILKSNNSTDPKEIAKITGTTAIDPEFTEEEYLLFVDSLTDNDYLCVDTESSEFTDFIKALYPSFRKYHIYDGWYFFLFRYDKYNFVVFNNNFDIISFISEPRDFYVNQTDLNGNPIYSQTEYGEFSKIEINGGYFDKKGLFYNEAEKVRYYSKDGNTYRYYTYIDENEKNEDEMKKYCLRDSKGNIYPHEKCFIDKDGWLVINDSEIKIDQNANYTNANGEQFTPALDTSWNEDGNVTVLSDFTN